MFRAIIFLLFLTQCNTSKVAFGSCSKVDEPQPLWRLVSSRKPDVFAWLGDNVYADMRKSDFYKSPNIFRGKGPETLRPGERPRFVARTKEDHENMYIAQKSNPDYAHLAKTTKIIGTWDDHDCGINDADKYFSKKQERQDLHLDFLNVPKNDSRRTREGVYTSHNVGGIKVILLDVRSNRDPWPWHPGAREDFDRSDMLGEEQWSWLEKELTEKDIENIDLILVGSGFQVLPIIQVATEKHESWVQFTESRNRLISTLSKAKVATMLLSGDVHFAELSQIVCTSTDTKKERRLMEFTSSGLTHAWAGPYNWPKPMPAPVIFRGFWHLWKFVGVHPWRLDAYAGLNFGEIELGGHENVIVRAVGVDNTTKFERSVRLGDLLGGESMGGRIDCQPLNGNPSKSRVLVSKVLFFGILFCIISGLFLFACKIFWMALNVFFNAVRRMIRKAPTTGEKQKVN
eukprot:g9933.t1